MVDLYYQIIQNSDPEAEWVVFVHGVGGSILTWKKQIDAFLVKYNILMFDLPGHGQSQEKKYNYVDIDGIVDGIKNILAECNIQKAHFVGLSLGTVIILHYAIKYPDSVTSVTLAGAIIKVLGSGKFLMECAQWIKEILSLRTLSKFFAWVLMPRKNHEKSRRIFIRESLKMKKETLSAWIKYMGEICHPDKYISEFNSAVRCKVLCVMGDEDRIFLRGAKKLVSMMNDAQMIVIKHCGHVCSIEKADEFNAIVLAFLNSLPIKQQIVGAC